MAKISRRDAIQILSGGIGVGVAVPGLAADHPMHEHLADQTRVATAEKKAAAVQYKPVFLNAHEFATTKSLAERIVPGASKAKSAEFIDQLLAVDTQANQRGFLNALGSFEGKAIEKSKGPWTKLPPAQQDEILTEASSAESGMRLRDHFDLLKGWIAGAYYSSEIGMRELGWTGNVMFAEFPGCPHPEGHQ
jgi:Gluconate 2-dehydrogenase subunit 3